MSNASCPDMYSTFILIHTNIIYLSDPWFDFCGLTLLFSCTADIWTLEEEKKKEQSPSGVAVISGVSQIK